MRDILANHNSELQLDSFKKKLISSINKVENWVETHDYKGYEPFDGLSSFIRPLTFGNLFLDRILMQVIRQSPVNLRPIFGVKPLDSTKGRGYMAWGYLTRYKLTKDENYKKKAFDCLDWLIKNTSPKFSEYTWGNHFDFAGRSGRYSKFEPIIVWTVLIGYAFLDAYEMFNEPKYLEVAISICRWILDLPREKTSAGNCISYYAFKQTSIHNSNMLGAAILARTGRIINNRQFLNVAREAMHYSCSRQQPDGSWYYAEASNMHWIDNFHTGYNLDSLKCYIENSADQSFRENLKKGFIYFKTHFFDEIGRPKYYHNRLYPIDSQCMAQAIETLANFAEFDEAALPLGVKVAELAIDNMQDKKGYFYYRQYPYGIKAKTPMLHWAQATLYKALTLLIFKIEKY